MRKPLLPIAALIVVAPLAANAQELALKRVVLSTGGVGYFEFEAEVSGNADLELAVRRDQLDDVLKSLVVFDDRGGVGGVRLPGEQPLEQAFRDLPFGRDALASPAALLNALQGAELAVDGPQKLKGRILRAVPETVAQDGRNTVTTRHRVTLVTPAGLQQFVLEEATAIALADPALQADVGRALDALARHRSEDRRTLKVLSHGSERRRVRVGYLAEVPLWKTAYRLTQAADPLATTGRLQGWAVIENLSGHDWREVDLALVSGSPVTFRQALYRAYYVPRPEIPIEVIGRVLPRLDEGTVGGRAAAEAPQNELRVRKAAAPPRGQLADSAALAREMAAPALAQAVAEEAVAGSEATTQVEFRFPRPVTLAAGESLTLPIVDRELPAAAVVHYQPPVQPRHPFAAVRLKNDGDSGLPPGALTLYHRGDNGVSYVGDARMGPLAAGESRLLAFALDTKTRIDAAAEAQQAVAQGSIARGLFRYTLIDRRTITYRIAAPAREARTLILEHPRQPGWRLARPDEKGAEIAPSGWRFAVPLKAGEEATFTVVLEQPRLESVRIAELAPDRLAAFAAVGELEPKVREAFRDLGRLRAGVDEARRALERLQAERKQLFEDQSRLRENLARVPRDSQLYRTYLDKLAQQETGLEALMRRTDAAQAAVDQAQARLADFIDELAL